MIGELRKTPWRQNTPSTKQPPKMDLIHFRRLFFREVKRLTIILEDTNGQNIKFLANFF